MDAIRYARERKLSAADFVSVLKASGLAERRPVDDLKRVGDMVHNADLIVTARDCAGKIVGVARSITDWSYCLYCSDLAVDKEYQGQGIGKKLLEQTVVHAPNVKSFLLASAPGAVSFYENAGYARVHDAFLFHSNA